MANTLDDLGRRQRRPWRRDGNGPAVVVPRPRRHPHVGLGGDATPITVRQDGVAPSAVDAEVPITSPAPPSGSVIAAATDDDSAMTLARLVDYLARRGDDVAVITDEKTFTYTELASDIAARAADLGDRANSSCSPRAPENHATTFQRRAPDLTKLRYVAQRSRGA